MKLLGAALAMVLWQSAVSNQQSAVSNQQSADSPADCRLLIADCSQPRTIWDGVFTADQAKRGDVLYQGVCAGCHGAALDGMDTAPALAGGAFMAQWDGVTLADMAERIRVTMPIDRPGTLGRQQVVDLLAYILRFNGVPPGDAELSPQSTPLREIRFVATKP